VGPTWNHRRGGRRAAAPGRKLRWPTKPPKLERWNICFPFPLRVEMAAQVLLWQPTKWRRQHALLLSHAVRFYPCSAPRRCVALRPALRRGGERQRRHVRVAEVATTPLLWHINSGSPPSSRPPSSGGCAHTNRRAWFQQPNTSLNQIFG